MNNVLQFLSNNLVVLLGAPCMLTFLLFAWDKSLAHFNSRQRVPEAVLITLCILMGAFGALCAMVLFHHKTAKLHFRLLVPLLTIAQLAAIVIIQHYAL
ncbi:MAG: DUF1294 domain-containing protein [Prevotella sp.]|nr:DUF1294 domain-containing protein [Prevotella sp.]